MEPDEPQLPGVPEPSPKRRRRPKRVIYVHPDLKGAPGLDQLAKRFDMRVWPEEMCSALVVGPVAWHFDGVKARAGLWKLMLLSARPHIPGGTGPEAEDDDGTNPEQPAD